MTIERVIYAEAGLVLVAGLAWRPPSGGKPSRGALREARSLTDASAFTFVRSDTQAVYGLFQARPSEEDQSLPKGALAAAAIFALAVGAQAPNAALVLQILDADGQAGKHYLVMLDDGLPAIDLLAGEADVLRALGDDDRPVWSDNAVRFPHSQAASTAWLAGLGAQPQAKSATIARFPVNPWPALVAAVLLVAAAGGWVAVNHHKAEVARQAAIAAAAAADPRPKYLAALAGQRATAASDRSRLIEAAGALFKLPAFVPGWQLRSVDCDVRAQTCDARWQRKGGRFEELAAAVPGQQLVPPAAEGAAPAFDEASTRWALAIQREPLPLELPTYDAAVTRAGNMFQRWKTADIALDMKPPTLWPVVAGVPSSLRLPQTLARGEVVVKEVPAPFVVEALRTAPAWLSWNAVHLEVADPSAGSARSQLKFTLSGNYYVSTTH